MTTKKKTTKKRKRRVSRWELRKTLVVAVTKPEQIAAFVPDGFEVLRIEGLGALGRKLWLHVEVVPKK